MSEQQWTTTQVATHLGVAPSTVRAYKARGQMPPPDGTVGSTPWWRPGTITGWVRPGRGAGGGPGQVRAHQGAKS